MRADGDFSQDVKGLNCEISTIMLLYLPLMNTRSCPIETETLSVLPLLNIKAFPPATDLLGTGENVNDLKISHIVMHGGVVAVNTEATPPLLETPLEALKLNCLGFTAIGCSKVDMGNAMYWNVSSLQYYLNSLAESMQTSGRDRLPAAVHKGFEYGIYRVVSPVNDTFPSSLWPIMDRVAKGMTAPQIQEQTGIDKEQIKNRLSYFRGTRRLASIGALITYAHLTGFFDHTGASGYS